MIGREYNPRWIIQCGVKPLRQTCRQLEFECREFKSAPKILDLRPKFEQKDLEWLIRTGRLATVTTLELSITMSSSIFFSKFFQAAFYVYMTRFEKEWFSVRGEGTDSLLVRCRTRIYPNLEVALIHGSSRANRWPSYRSMLELKIWLQRPLLEVIYL